MANESDIQETYEQLLLDEFICITTALQELKEENRRLELVAATLARANDASEANTDLSQACCEMEPWISYLALEKHEQCIPCEECGSICCIRAQLATTH